MMYASLWVILNFMLLRTFLRMALKTHNVRIFFLYLGYMNPFYFFRIGMAFGLSESCFLCLLTGAQNTLTKKDIIIEIKTMTLKSVSLMSFFSPVYFICCHNHVNVMN